MRHTKLLIIGSGPAGYTAAVYGSRALLSPVLLSGFQPGGQMTITTDVENYPGFSETIQGPWLMDEMRRQAEHVGAELIADTVISADLSSRPFRFTTESGTDWSSDSVVIATGAQAKWLGLESEEKYKGFGVSACATCDGFFYRDKSVIVVGGGNTAVEEALYLSSLASSVLLIHRRDSLRAERILQDRLFSKSNVEILWDSELVEVCGTDGVMRSVESAKIKNLKTGEVHTHSIDGIFIAIGHSPSVELFSETLRLKPSGYLWTRSDSTATEIPGVFAAGDVTDDIYRQAVTAAGQGCMAALEAEKFLSETLCDSSCESSCESSSESLSESMPASLTGS